MRSDPLLQCGHLAVDRAAVTDIVVEARDLHRSYQVGKDRKIDVLRGLSLEIKIGEQVFLTGPSGAGKTTLMYTLAGLERPEKGAVFIQDHEIYAMGRRPLAALRNSQIGYIFQNYHLLPELTAVENANLPGLISGKDRTERAKAALEKVGLSHRLNHLPGELSGGEQQRVAIARAIVNEPAIIFADEPTGNLDSKNGEEIIQLLFGLAEEQNSTLIVVTHDQELAKRGQRTLVVKDGIIVSDT